MELNNPIKSAVAGEKAIQSLAFVIASVLCLLLSIIFVRVSVLQQRQRCEIRLDGRINPNEAGAQSLMRLPGVGQSLAGAIVVYRENFADANRPAFGRVEDLQKVTGIGVKRAKKIKQWLRFEQKEPH